MSLAQNLVAQKCRHLHSNLWNCLLANFSCHYGVYFNEKRSSSSGTTLIKDYRSAVAQLQWLPQSHERLRREAEDFLLLAAQQKLRVAFKDGLDCIQLRCRFRAPLGDMVNLIILTMIHESLLFRFNTFFTCVRSKRKYSYQICYVVHIFV